MIIPRLASSSYSIYQSLLRDSVTLCRCQFRTKSTGESGRSRFASRRNIDENPVRVGVLGVPHNEGQGLYGAKFGSRAIRDAGLINNLTNYRGLVIQDYGTLKFRGLTSYNDDVHDGDDVYKQVLNPTACGMANEQLSSAVANVLGSNDKCVVLGGDHSLATGSIHGHASVHKDISVLWVDAHPDLNCPKSSPSGNLHGMPLHFVLKELQNKRIYLPSYDWCKPCLSSVNLAFIAIRDIDPAEIEILRNHDIAHCSIRDIDQHGIHHCMERLLDMINPMGNRSLHVSFDIDSIDQSIAPSTGTPVPGGLSYREAMYISEQVAGSGCLRVLDLVEVNPKIGTAEDVHRTASTAVDVITHNLGLSVRNTDNRLFKRIQ